MLLLYLLTVHKYSIYLCARQSRESALQMESKLRQELDSQTRLASLYKEASQDGEKRVHELTAAVSELQSLLKTANEGEREDLSHSLKSCIVI